MSPSPHLVIGTPCFGGQVSSIYTSSLLGLQSACAGAGIGFTLCLLGGDAMITRARNTIVTQFMETPGATHLLFIDADIGFEPDAALRLLRSGHEVAAGIYPTKTIDWPTVAKRAADPAHPLPAGALQYVVDYGPPESLTIEDGFCPVRHAGTGFLMVARAVFERLEVAHPHLRYAHVHRSPDPHEGSAHRYAFFDGLIDEPTGTYLSEDYVFCKRWQGLGGQIWADLESRLTHVGTLSLTGDVRARYGAL